MAGVEVGDIPPSKDEYEEDEFVFVDPGLDQDLMHIRVAEMLNISALDVGGIPAHWVGSCLIRIEADEIYRKHREKHK